MSINDVCIKNVKIQNYRSLEDVSITLNEGLNIIIGYNNAGKSNFLKFLGIYLSDSLQSIIGHWGVTDQPRVNVTYSISIEKKTSSEISQIDFGQHAVANVQKGKTAHIEYKKTTKDKLIEAFTEPLPLHLDKKKAIYALVDLGFLMQNSFIQFDDPKEMPYITFPGKLSLRQKNLVAEESSSYSRLARSSALFNSFEAELEVAISHLYENSKISPQKIKEELISLFNQKKQSHDYNTYLKKYSPITDIRLNDNINIYDTGHNIIIENIVLNFKLDENWVPWSYLSDGTARLFQIITEVVFSNGDVILIEEPEMGIHPDQLFKILDFLQSQTPKKQIIFSTHSPISLDVLSPNELNQIIIAKMTKNGTTLKHLEAEQIDKAKMYIQEVGNLSAYWLHSDLEQ